MKTRIEHTEYGNRISDLYHRWNTGLGNPMTNDELKELNNGLAVLESFHRHQGIRVLARVYREDCERIEECLEFRGQ